MALIDNIYVYEGNRIEISMKYRDDFEMLVEYIEINKSLLTEIARQQLDKYVDAGVLVGVKAGML